MMNCYCLTFFPGVNHNGDLYGSKVFGSEPVPGNISFHDSRSADSTGVELRMQVDGDDWNV